MNNYGGEARSRRQNLLIVEGKHEKNELFRLLFRCFPEMQISMEDICANSGSSDHAFR